MSPYSQSQNLKNKNLIIFDFDGVLADSFDTFYPFIRDMMGRVGVKMSRDDYRKLFLDNIHKGFEKFINNSEKYKMFNSLREANYDKYYKKYPPKLFPEASKLIKRLNKNYKLTIASSGRRKNINGLLKKNKIQKHFDLVLATNDHSKKDMIQEILNKHRNEPKETIMITDTVGDIKIAKKLGLKTIAVTWGFHPKKYLTKAKPDHISTNIKNLLNLLNTLTK